MMEPDMSMMKPSPASEPEAINFAAEMDQLSLTQALHDFDVANARVVDLTQRLIGAGREMANLREQLTALQRDHEALRIAHEAMQRSRAYKLANTIFAIRRVLSGS